MKQVNVLHVIDHLGFGGAQTIVKELLTKWESNNIKLICYALRKSSTNFEQSSTQIFTLDHKSKYNVNSFFDLKNVVKTENIKILHLHLPKSIIFGILLKTFYYKDLKIIVHEHGEIFENRFLYNNILKIFQNKIDLFIAISEATKMKLIENAWVDEKKIKILYNFVDIDNFNSDKIKNYDRTIERRRIGINKDDFIIGFAGRLNKIKGCDILINSIIFIKIPNLKVIIAGNGIERKELEKLAKNLTIEDKIIFLGYVKDMIMFYNLIDCLVIPSRSEAFGLSAIEAQALGVPVIAANIKGLSEVVLDKKTGLLFEPGNERDLAEKIELIYNDENLRMELTKKGLNNVRKYSLDNYLLNLKNIYENH